MVVFYHNVSALGTTSYSSLQIYRKCASLYTSKSLIDRAGKRKRAEEFRETRLANTLRSDAPPSLSHTYSMYFAMYNTKVRKPICIVHTDIDKCSEIQYSTLGLYPGVASSLVSRGFLGTLPGDSSWKTEEGSFHFRHLEGLTGEARPVSGHWSVVFIR